MVNNNSFLENNKNVSKLSINTHTSHFSVYLLRVTIIFLQCSLIFISPPSAIHHGYLRIINKQGLFYGTVSCWLTIMVRIFDIN